MRRRIRPLWLVLPGLIGLPAAAAAETDHHRYPRAKVDIERLKAEIRSAGSEWRVDVQYEVEVEGRGAHREELALVLFVTDEEGVLADPDGKPIEVRIPLDRPSEIEDDEIEFKAGTAFTLPDGAFARVDRLRIEAVVIDVRDESVLERESAPILYEPPIVYERVEYEPSVAAEVVIERPVFHASVIVERPVCVPPPVVHRRVVIGRSYGLAGGVHIGHSRHVTHTRVIRPAPLPVYHRSLAVHRSYHRATGFGRP